MSTETNAERLERFKAEWLGDGDELQGEDIDFLIEQAECFQSVEEENARLRKALAFYAEFSNYDQPLHDHYRGPVLGDSLVQEDVGRIAKTALEGEG